MKRNLRKSAISGTLSIFIMSCSAKYASLKIEPTNSVQNEEKVISKFEVEENVLQKFTEKKPEENTITTIENEMQKNKGPKLDHVKQKKLKPKPKMISSKSILSSLPPDYPETLKKLQIDSKSSWNVFQPRVYKGEEMHFKVRVMGITMGNMVFASLGETILGEEDVYHFSARLQTSGMSDLIYSVDNTIDSYVKMENFTPLKYSYIQRESKQDVDDLQLFDQDKLMTYSFFYRKTSEKEKKKKKESFIPSNFQDPFSVLFFIRGLPLKTNDKYLVPVVNKGEILLLNIIAEVREEIRTEIGKVKTIKVVIKIEEDGDSLKKGDLSFWFIDDEHRPLVKVTGETNLGSLQATITKYIAGK